MALTNKINNALEQLQARGGPKPEMQPKYQDIGPRRDTMQTQSRSKPRTALTPTISLMDKKQGAGTQDQQQRNQAFAAALGRQWKKDGLTDMNQVRAVGDIMKGQGLSYPEALARYRQGAGQEKVYAQPVGSPQEFIPADEAPAGDSRGRRFAEALDRKLTADGLTSEDARIAVRNIAREQGLDYAAARDRYFGRTADTGETIEGEFNRDPEGGSPYIPDNTILDTGEAGGVSDIVDPEAGRVSQIDPAQGGRPSGYEAMQREVTPNELASVRADEIMRSGSPLAMLAEQRGREMANAMGGLNSSIAAGNIMRSLADYAVPMARDEAQTYSRQGLTNQAEINRASAFTADQQFRMEALNTEVRARAEEINAQFLNTMRESSRDREFELERQGIANQAAIDLAETEGYYRQIISQNDTAARLYSDYQSTVAQILGNDKIRAGEASEKIRYANNILNSGLDALQLLNGLDLSDLQDPNPGGRPYTSGAMTPSLQAIRDRILQQRR